MDKLISKFGEEKARQYAEANETAIKMVADLVKEKNIDCDFNWRSAYTYTQSDKYIEKIEKEVKSASKLGIKATFLDKIELPFDIKAAIKFEEQAEFHPLKYLLTLAKEIHEEGNYIFEHTKVVDIEEKEKCVVITNEGEINPVPKDVEVNKGEAKVVNIHGEKFGAYRDEDGKLHVVDVTCTHLGCELIWNEAEKTWDCPCHGSRFTYDGDNVEGPAFNNLNSEGQGPNKKDSNIF